MPAWSFYICTDIQGKCDRGVTRPSETSSSQYARTALSPSHFAISGCLFPAFWLAASPSKGKITDSRPIIVST